MAADDRKRPNAMTLRLTDRELLDASRQAVIEDRTLADYVHFILRRSLYGSMGVAGCDCKDGPSMLEHRATE
jgi:hypothetical protein